MAKATYFQKLQKPYVQKEVEYLEEMIEGDTNLKNYTSWKWVILIFWEDKILLDLKVKKLQVELGNMVLIKGASDTYNFKKLLKTHNVALILARHSQKLDFHFSELQFITTPKPSEKYIPASEKGPALFFPNSCSDAFREWVLAGQNSQLLLKTLIEMF